MPGFGGRARPLHLKLRMERRREADRQAHLERTKREVADRLRPVCTEMPEHEFQNLVEQVVATKIKYSLQRTDDLFAEAHVRRPKDSPPDRPE